MAQQIARRRREQQWHEGEPEQLIDQISESQEHTAPDQFLAYRPLGQQEKGSETEEPDGDMPHRWGDPGRCSESPGTAEPYCRTKTSRPPGGVRVGLHDKCKSAANQPDQEGISNHQSC